MMCAEGSPRTGSSLDFVAARKTAAREFRCARGPAVTPSTQHKK